MKEIVLITGANGLIAKELAKKIGNEYEVRFLTRKKRQANEYEWDLKKKTIDETAFNNVSHIIHLAGANISENRWTAERKKRTYCQQSRFCSIAAKYFKKKRN
ncbi:NAD-dependent epimerase/dehydratase family protein [Chryseobacterium capnotolerans]|uniref:NAD-dependent epimerase/dehydratase family protein n=1 Tax=Chryseobacterium capnotolerans TaxID=2759528 RepID=UPI001E625D20|nr:NAD-dependent epimerase/dehydratase family protein [Chryseobacterium capnotolerans]